MRRLIRVLLLLGCLLFAGCLPSHSPSPTGYWQGSLAGQTLQVRLYQENLTLQGWIKIITAYNYYILPVVAGTFVEETGSVTFQAVDPAAPDNVYTFSGELTYSSMFGECNHTYPGGEEELAWEVGKAGAVAYLTGYWEGELTGDGFDARLQFDLVQSQVLLQGYIRTLIGNSLEIYTVTSGTFDQELKTIKIITERMASPTGEERWYEFDGTLIWDGGNWGEMAGRCRYIANGEETELRWNVVLTDSKD